MFNRNENNLIIKSDLKNQSIYLFMMFISVITLVATLLDFSKPYSYFWLFLLPLSFLFFMFICKSCWSEIPQNFGLTILIILEFIRLVITPIFLVLGDYHEIITLNIEDNTAMASLLMFYETMCIAFALRIKIPIKYESFKNIDNNKCNHKMNILMGTIILFTAILCVFAPEILKNYRSIWGLFTDKYFTTVEQSFIVNQYSTSIAKKFFLVTVNYVLKVIRILLPLYLMIWSYLKFNNKAKMFCIFLVLSPLIFVDGAIARSIYFVLFLMLIYQYLYKIDVKKLYKPLTIGCICAIGFFSARLVFVSDSVGLLDYISDKLVDYFAGLNIVSGSFNLPTSISLRFHYFIGDLLRTIPFANTLFGLSSSDTIQIFFNTYNGTTGGQIPTTIGMGAYYFGFIFAPFYSVLFARLCKNYGRKYQVETNPYYKLIYLYISFISALGIGMYNMEIALGTLVQVIFPIYLVVRIAYPKIKGRKSIHQRR
ncbi:O-antigen polymerase [Clostridium paraputrificum]|uniref:O-antigen polymerase n=1 Tax=Clostridium paraputrificum TaxID=29363 RepID=UPI003D33EE85